MARILKKIPNFKLPKLKMKEFEEIEELKLEYTADDLEKMKEFEEIDELLHLYTPEDLDRMKEKLPGKHGHHECYPGTDYKTIKEIFNRSTTLFAEKEFILETFNKKKGFEEITYGQFRKDVINFGTGLTKALKLEGERVIIISETTYNWYVSYIALLCGAGIAVPCDKELPENELENLWYKHFS